MSIALAPPSASRTAWLRRVGLPVLIFAALALAPMIGLLGAERYVFSLLTRIVAFAIAALSLDLILGFGAMVSFGHAAFIGIGAYTTGILAAHDQPDFLLALGLAMLASGAFALVTGAISLRTKGVYFIMITLAFGQMAYFVATSLKAYGGDDGLTLATRSTVFGTALLKNNLVFYYVSLAILAGLFLFCRMLIASRFGRVLRGTRENPVRMQAIGFNPYPYQLTAYVFSGMMAGIAGVLLANVAEFVSPAYMTWQRSGELIIMVVMGGMGTLHGAVLGAVALLGLEEMLSLSSYTKDWWKLIFGPLLILIVLLARGGLLGLMEGRRR
jgi:branched-chain amino acid transport system permease protein